MVYPVCIYYFQRATYLCAFGQTLKNKRTINWHNYRLDRIQELRGLDWLNPSIPADVRHFYDTNQLDQPEYILHKISAAWDLDFYRESRKMLIRFNQDFSQSYIKNSFRHETFRFLNDKQEFIQFIRDYKPNE
ncbi:TIGR03985 family CRISPR-associated protein [Nostoc sp. TCL240-02]|uniref:TIGR03985 family CRISPR-associated protein n=1 Tax=Nostoc sp. TCL240-02 TaxID=2572090 RepID=UPI00157F9B0E|nr:TIGR03985 family CRISPR-associated protein [Nostoc sp. TCL240-02]